MLDGVRLGKPRLNAQIADASAAQAENVANGFTHPRPFINTVSKSTSCGSGEIGGIVYSDALSPADSPAST